jgi:hypothetical protein
MSPAATRLAEQRRSLVLRARAERATLAAAWRAIEEPAARASLWWRQAATWGAWVQARPWLWALPVATLVVLQTRRRPASPGLGWMVSMALPWLLRTASARWLGAR